MGELHRDTFSLSFSVRWQLPPASVLLPVCALITHTFYLFNCLSNPRRSKVRAEILSPLSSPPPPAPILCILLHKDFPPTTTFLLIGAGILIETFWVKTFLDVNGQQRRQKWNCCNFNEYIQFYYFKSSNVIAFSIQRLKKFSPIINRILMEMAEVVMDSNSH